MLADANEETSADEPLDDDLVESDPASDLLGNPFFGSMKDEYFHARLGQRGGALARKIADVLDTYPSEVCADALRDLVHARHGRRDCLFMPEARHERGHRPYRSVYCVDLDHFKNGWVGPSLEEQFQWLSIHLHGDLMNAALDSGRDWKDLLPEEIIVITNRWETGTADWLPILRAWNKLVKSVELYLVMPGIATRIEL